MQAYCVDDHPLHAKKSSELAEKFYESKGISGYKVEQCNSGADFLKKAASAKPDLVLMDINMPELDGLSALIRYKSLYPTAKTKVIMVSSETKTVTKRLDTGKSRLITDENKKQELLGKVIDRVQKGLKEEGKINTVLEACATLAMDPVEIAKKHGANGYIVKPYDIDEAIKVLDKII